MGNFLSNWPKVEIEEVDPCLGLEGEELEKCKAANATPENTESPTNTTESPVATKLPTEASTTPEATEASTTPVATKLPTEASTTPEPAAPAAGGKHRRRTYRKRKRAPRKQTRKPESK